ncbi:RCC1 domain-containing protein [Burkholderia sp. LMU1-1-1.1]|uniref:RCC1 domain-containing protein n=1 Tax=Burkholderia sp. LMU1-1-1.1 TaxID=3135266 RepID=UPI00343EF02F
MKFLAPRLSLLPATLLLSVLGACGGGGGNGASAPVPQPPPPAPPATPAPTISNISPATAILTRPTDFEVTGTDLGDGMRFQLAGCVATEAAGGGKTRRVFSCTPSGTAGEYPLQLYASAATTSSLASKTVTYLTPVAKVGEVNRKLAVLKEDGSLWVWENDWDKSTTGNVVTINTRLGSNYTDIEAGSAFGMAIDADGGLWAWGYNNDGVFAEGPPAGSPTPVQIGKDYAKVAAKGAHTSGGERVVGLKRDGGLWAWGARSSPVPESPSAQLIPHQFGSGFSDLATGTAGNSMALKADGSLWSWNENISPTPFVPTKSGDGYQTVVSAYDAHYGIKKNGELWAWGRNAIKRDQAASDDTPVLVGPGYASLSAGSYYVMALKADGTLWGFGSNSEGQFGDGTSRGGGPVQSASGVRKVWAGDSCTVIEKRDGTLWATAFCTLGATTSGPLFYGFRRLPQY